MILPTDTIVLLVDGARMLLLRNIGDAIAPEFEVVEHRECEGLPDRELASDAPGRAFASRGVRRSSYDDAELHRQEEERFIVAAAAALDEQLQREHHGAIVVAPPAALGLLRRHYGPHTRKRLTAEVDKDLTQLPVADIVHRLLVL